MKPRRTLPSVESSSQASTHQITAHNRRVDLFLLLMVSIWGANFAVVKFALEDFYPLSFNAIRYLIASTLLTIAVRAQHLQRNIERRDLIQLIGLGVLANCVYQIMFIEGINLTLAGNTALILGATPVFVTLLSAWRGHEQLGRRSLVGIAASFLGVILIVFSSHETIELRGTFIGDLLVFGCTLLWPIYSVGLRPLMVKYGDLECTRITMISGTIPLVLIAIPSLRSQPWDQVRPGAWGGLMFSAVLAIAVCYSIWNYGVRHVGNTRTSNFSNLTQVVTLLVAWPFLGERPKPGQVVGMVIIFFGIYLTRRDRMTRLPGGTGV